MALYSKFRIEHTWHSESLITQSLREYGTADTINCEPFSNALRRDPAPVQATSEIPIAEAYDTDNRKMDNILKTFRASPFEIITLNEPRYGSYPMGRVCAIQADKPPQYAPNNIPSLNAPIGPAYCKLEPNYQQHPWSAFGTSINGDMQRHIGLFYSDVPTEPENDIVNFNECGRQTFRQRDGKGEEISRY